MQKSKYCLQQLWSSETRWTESRAKALRFARLHRFTELFLSTACIVMAGIAGCAHLGLSGSEMPVSDTARSRPGCGRINAHATIACLCCSDLGCTVTVFFHILLFLTGPDSRWRHHWGGSRHLLPHLWRHDGHYQSEWPQPRHPCDITDPYCSATWAGTTWVTWKWVGSTLLDSYRWEQTLQLPVTLWSLAGTVNL